MSDDRHQTRLRGISWDHPRGFQPLISTADGYAQRTHVCIEWTKRSLRDFGDAGIDKLATENDLLVIDHPWVGFAAATGCLKAMDTLLAPDTLTMIASGAVGSTYQSYSYDGHQWALPVDAAAQVSAYRPDLLIDAGVQLPGTWAEVVALAAELSRVGLRIAMPLNETDAFPALLTLCANRRHDPFDDSGRVFDRDVLIDGLQDLRQLCAVSDRRSLGLSPPGILDEMASTNVIAYAPILFGYSNYSRRGFRSQLIRFSDIPSAGFGPVGSTLGGAGIAVSDMARDPQSAARYAAWVASAHIQATEYFDAGGQPCQRRAWLDPRLNAVTNGFFESTISTLEGAYTRPRHRTFVQLQIQAGTLINRWLQSEAFSASELATRLVDLSTRTLDE